MYSHHELKGIDGEKEREYWKKKNLFQIRALFGMKHNMYALLFIVQNHLRIL